MSLSLTALYLQNISERDAKIMRLQAELNEKTVSLELYREFTDQQLKIKDNMIKAYQDDINKLKQSQTEKIDPYEVAIEIIKALRKMNDVPNTR